MSEEVSPIPTLQAMYDARLSSLLSVHEQRKAVADAMMEHRTMSFGHVRVSVSTTVLLELLDMGYGVDQDQDGRYVISWLIGPTMHAIKKMKTNH